MENKFKINSRFKPEGNQPNAIAQLTRGLKAGKKASTCPSYHNKN
jgi:excinuclease UvrABC helicase subunit UvrB